MSHYIRASILSNPMVYFGPKLYEYKQFSEFHIGLPKSDQTG